MAMQFEWDEEKVEINLRKHKVGFEEAKTVFGDPFSITVDDPDHSTDEQRYIDIGKSSASRAVGIFADLPQRQIQFRARGRAGGGAIPLEPHLKKKFFRKIHPGRA